MIARTFALTLAVLIPAAPAVFAWGEATHAYIADHIGKRDPGANRNEMYGAQLPDVFNTAFDLPADLQMAVRAMTHEDYARVWRKARCRSTKALAFGFASHNERNGADSTAHVQSLTLGEGTGYVIAKATILADALKQIPAIQQLGLPDAMLEDVAHILIEVSADLLVKRADPAIGGKLVAASLLRSPAAKRLLIEAYAADLAAASGTTRAEAAARLTRLELELRKTTLLYGQALMQDEATALQLLAEQVAALGAVYLASQGIALPPGVDLAPVAAFGIGKGMELCAPDLARELQATTAFVKQQLRRQGIEY